MMFCFIFLNISNAKETKIAEYKKLSFPTVCRMYNVRCSEIILSTVIDLTPECAYSFWIDRKVAKIDVQREILVDNLNKERNGNYNYNFRDFKMVTTHI